MLLHVRPCVSQAGSYAVYGGQPPSSHSVDIAALGDGFERAAALASSKRDAALGLAAANKERQEAEAALAAAIRAKKSALEQARKGFGKWK